MRTNYSVALIILFALIGLLCPGSGVAAEDIKAMFAPVPLIGPAPLNVSFVDQSEGNVTNWNWDLDNDGTWDSYDQNPTYTFTSPGRYAVNLTVWNGTGVRSTRGAEVNVTDPIPGPLKAGFTASPRIGYPPLEVNFIDQSVGDVKNWTWDFGETEPSPMDEIHQKNPNHTYSEPGWFTVTLNVSDNYSASLGRTSQCGPYANFIHVLPLPTPESLVANFTAAPVRGVAPLEVQFFDQSNGTPTAWRWSFGDGEQLNEQGPNHTYQIPGIYNVTLQAFNRTGNSNILEKPGYITALSPTIIPRVTYRYVDLSNLKNIQFYDQSQGVGINAWNWDFGDGISSTEQNPVHEFTAGKYKVLFTVSNGYAINTHQFIIEIS